MNYSTWLEKELPFHLNGLETVNLKSVNKGPRYRVVAEEVSGSLWLEPQQEALRLKLTGDVLTQLRNFVVDTVGHATLVDQGYPVWKVIDPRLLLRILEKLNHV